MCFLIPASLSFAPGPQGRKRRKTHPAKPHSYLDKRNMATSATWKPTFAPIGESSSSILSNEKENPIRLVSYNILAQAYVKSVLFPHSPPGCLRWKARSQALLDRLLSFEADILCLQELDEFESFYKGQLAKHGYSSIYLKRPGKKRDGCGIFYQQDRLELIDQEFIHYNDLVPRNEPEEEVTNGESSDTESDRGDPNDPKVRLRRDCVGILAAFRVPHLSDNVFLLANTHIYWDPEWVDVKLAQANYLVKCVLEFRRKLENNLSENVPVIICGDFNSTPGDKVYTYLTSSRTVEDLLSDLSVKDQNQEVEDAKSRDSILPLRSVYGCVQGEPAFTNFTPDFTGTLDYIFASSLEHIEAVGLLELPTHDSVEVVGGLPNRSHPSDHLPIGFEFIIHRRK